MSVERVSWSAYHAARVEDAERPVISTQEVRSILSLAVRRGVDKSEREENHTVDTYA